MTQALFSLGKCVATPGALEAIGHIPGMIFAMLHDHCHGDWGAVCDEDKETNNQAVVLGNRILSAYPIDETKPCEGFGENTIWIITEADRSVTTILLPEEY